MCSYCCSWSVSCSVWRYCGVWTGCLFGLPQKARPSAPRCNVFSSPVPQTIAPPVASPAPTRQVEGQRLHLCVGFREVKSRRGAPKRVDTEGFACPNPQCQYFSNTDALFHALVGDGKHGRAEPIQTFRCQACRTTFTSRRNTPLYRLKTPSQKARHSPLCAGRGAGSFGGFAGLRPPTSHHYQPFCPVLANTRTPCTSASSSICTSRICSWMNCEPGCAAPPRCVFLWLVIDPRTKLLPVLHLGPRTQNAAHTVIHSLRKILAAFLHSDLQKLRLKRVLLRFNGSFWILAREARRRGRIVQKSAGGSKADLRPGEEKLPATQAGTGHTGDEAGNRGRSHSRLPEMRLLWTTEHGVHRAGSTDRPTWCGRSRTPHLGDGAAISTASGPSRMVARI
jgi:hypothetical protein